MILITGAGGFLGNHLIKRLVSAGFDVVPLYRCSQVKIRDNRWEADLSNPKHIAQLQNVRLVPHTVVHLAGHIDISLKPNPLSPMMPPLPGKEDIYALYNENVLTTANVLAYCLYSGVKHIIHASTQAVYGMPSDERLTEDSVCRPIEHYAASKICSESVLKVGAQQGMSVSVLRFPGLYDENRREGTVYRFCMSALQKWRIHVKADIPLPIDVIHVEDVVDAFEKTIYFNGKDWTCLNISTGEPCNLNILADSIAELVPGCEVEHAVITQPVICMDSTNAYSILGWKAIPRRKRLSLMIDSLKKSDEFNIKEEAQRG